MLEAVAAAPPFVMAEKAMLRQKAQVLAGMPPMVPEAGEVETSA